MPKGLIRRSCSKTPKGFLPTTSSTRPNKSVDKLYSQVLPGCHCKGALANAATCCSGVNVIHKEGTSLENKPALM